MRSIAASILLFVCMAGAQEQNNLRAPGPTFTFGQNILKKGAVAGVESINYFETRNGSFFDNVHEIIVGITDNFSITGFLPVVLRDRELGCQIEQGLGNLILQAEQALINSKEPNFLHLSTIVGRIGFPTTTTDIPTIRSSRAYQFFVGVTNAILGNGWYFYNGFGGLFHTKRRGLRLRHRFIYDMGIGKIVQQTDRYYYALLIEMNGIYFGSPEVPEGIPINKKHRNVILIGPTLRYAGHKRIVQLGLQYPFTQKSFLLSRQITFRASFAFAWRF